MMVIDSIQAALNYESLGKRNEQFRGNGNGKMGTTGFLVGLLGGIHLGFVLTLLFIWALRRDLVDSILDREPYLYSVLVTVLHWSLYFGLLCIFHFMEFFTTAMWQPLVLKYDSYIVNHSKAYTIAALASWSEYWIESLLFPRYKHFYKSMVFAGFLMVACGQLIRTVGMWTCGKNFAHVIMTEKDENHQLVKHGIYSILRHPSYFGWFYWSVGTQVLLCNPICTIMYTYVSWSFFNSRIPHEEAHLVKFYKEEYVNYSKRTYIGIPFMSQ